jgi:hypothetical protein
LTCTKGILSGTLEILFSLKILGYMLILHGNKVHKVIRFNSDLTVTTESGVFDTEECKILTLGLVKGLMVYVDKNQAEVLNDTARFIPQWSNFPAWEAIGLNRFIVTGPTDDYPIGFYLARHTNYPEVSFEDMLALLKRGL